MTLLFLPYGHVHFFCYRGPVYAPLDAIMYLQVVLDGDSSSALLMNLTSRTDYLVSVFPIYVSGVGAGLRGITSTCRQKTSIVSLFPVTIILQFFWIVTQ